MTLGFIEEGRRARAEGLRMAVARELAADGLELPAGWGIVFHPGGDMATFEQGHLDTDGRDIGGHGIHVERGEHRPDDALLPRLVKEARGSVRRALTMPHMVRTVRETTPGVGWSALCHPLPMAICRAAGMPSVHLPFARTDPDECMEYTRRLRVVRALSWDIMGLTVTLEDEPVAVVKTTTEASHVAIRQDVPHTLALAAAGRRLVDVVEMPRCGDAHVDDAVASLIVHQVECDSNVNGGTMPGWMRMRLRQTRWLPWGDPPARHAHVFEAAPEFH